ncbi:metalloproteinase inhibitor 3-like isoform X2 [Apostichopus japonicus]|uniref:metalloproteinase inhibitor 3-like isoform X2 n=1 Tax=Stichopus japonicus TaxID=307972 RepID=UPI003AB91785
MSKAMWFSSVLSVVLLMSSIRNIQCCTCVLLHPQEEYCTSDYVIQGRVTAKDETFIDYERHYHYQLSQSPPPSQSLPWIIADYFSYFSSSVGFDAMKKIVYTVDIEKVFKRNGLTAKGTTVEIIVTHHAKLDCNVYLSINQNYVIMGNVVDDQLTLEPCGSYRNVDRITKRQSQGLKRQYKKNCNKCSICGQYDYCEIDFARCGKNKKGICVWLGGRDYKRCLRQQ